MIKQLISWINVIRLIPHSILMYHYRKLCREDILANSPASLHKKSVFSQWLYLMTFDKFYRALFYHRIGVWRHFISFLCPAHSCFFISPSTKIGQGLKLCHPFSTVVNAESIGDNVAIFQDVTIGVSAGQRPIIGNNVQIYTNSVIIGGIKVGDGVTIGACTLVNKDAPPHSVIVGIPGKLLRIKECNGDESIDIPY